MSMQIEAWYQHTTIPAVRSQVEPLIVQAGFNLAGNVGDGGVHGWEQLTLNGCATRYYVGERTEDHVVLAVLTRGKSASLITYYDAVFKALLSATNPSPCECILADTSADVYPFLTHSLPLQPVRVVEFDEAREVLADRGFKDPDYWAVFGPQVHFIANETLQRAGVSSPSSWAATVGARVVPAQGGILLDCGWSANWPGWVLKT
jgi:hypothetical protein